MWELSAAICTSHYKTKTTIETWPAPTVPGSCTLTAVETAEHVYTECAAKHWAEQSVCTSLDENAVTHSVCTLCDRYEWGLQVHSYCLQNW